MIDRTQRSVYIVAASAAIVLLVYGFWYRVEAARLNGPVGTTPVAQSTLDELPMEIADWSGEDVPVDDAIVAATDTDAHISRRYVARGRLQGVSLWIASGVKARDLEPHRPEICYVGAGWTQNKQDLVELPLPDGNVLPCNVMQFSRGVLNNERVMVLYYYLVDGEYCANVSLLRSRAWKGGGTIDYMAQVQIVTAMPVGTTPEAALDVVSTFAVESGPHVAELFERHLQKVRAEESQESAGD